MKKSKAASRLLSIFLILLMVTVCGSAKEVSAAEKEDASGSITVTDMMGREITLDKPAEKVIALSAADCEIIYAIGAEDTLVGRGEYCDYPAEALEITSVESGANTNIEQILSLEPDVLFMASMAQPKEQVDQLEAAGIKVIVSEAKDIEGVYTAIGLIGDVTGRREKADEVIGNMKDTFSKLKEKAAGDGSENMYFEVSPLEYGLWTAGNNTFMNEIASMIKVKNCFNDVEGWAEISEEQVLERNPDYIVTISMYMGEGPTPEEEIASRTGWDDLTAVKNGKILNLPDNELSRPGPRLADGAEMLFDFVYGDK
ncbi:MAG: ABC transporter substrate-binding protein [Eubacterium sp.]|nr:ABC transporter substrate-binding protein [Eubacterium sp.]